MVQARGLPPAADPLQDGRGQEAGRQTQDPGRPLRLLLGHVRSREVILRVTASHYTCDTYFCDVLTHSHRPVAQFMTSAPKCIHCGHVTRDSVVTVRDEADCLRTEDTIAIALHSQFLCFKLYNCYTATIRNIIRYTRRYY